MKTAGRVCGVATKELGMRKSCDPCRRKKRKCNGSLPCNRCLGAGSQCIYSKQRWYQVSPGSERQHTPAGPAGAHAAADASQPSTSGALLTHGMLPFKRCRLSASPATGLVGMQENTFISDFFRCIGFLPFTTQSDIRETMMGMFVRPAIGQPSQEQYDRGDSFDVITPEDSLNPDLRGRQLPKDLSTCVFWCAVALGALVRGNPIDSVAGYSQLARDALETYSGPATAEVARAWMILATLYLFCGDLDNHQEYLALSALFLGTAMEQGLTETLPVGFAELVQACNISHTSWGGDMDKATSFGAQDQAIPQLSEAATESDLYRFSTRLIIMAQQTVISAANNSGDVAGGSSSHVEADDEAEEADSRLFGASVDILETMPGRLEECISQFGRLEAAAERSSIRNGIGGLIINGHLMFEKAAKGDLPGTLERIGRCVEVYEKFPGLCRFEMDLSTTASSAHGVHVTIAALAAMDSPRARELYNTLRTTYNLTRLPGAAPIPPLEEWQGISHCCESSYCRAMEGLLVSGKMSVFSTRADTSGVHQEENRANDATGNRIGVDGQKNCVLSTRNVFEETLSSGPASSRFEGGRGQPEAGEAISCSSLLLRGGAELGAAPQTLAPTSPCIPTGEAQTVLNADLGGDEGVVPGGRTGAGGVAQALKMPLTAPESSGGGGEANETTNKDELDVEDWLDVALALSL